MSVEQARNPEAPQSPDRIARRMIMTVTFASLFIMALALVVAWCLLERWGREPRRGAPEVAPATIGSLEQTLILDTKRGIDLRAEEEASLHRWGWVDRDAGVGRIPIEAAMETLATEPVPADRPLDPPSAGASAEGIR